MKERIQTHVDLDTLYGELSDVPVTYDLITERYPAESHPDGPSRGWETCREVHLISIFEVSPQFVEQLGIDRKELARSLEARHDA